ncbi:transposase [Candidatus Enterovibrio altilux]|uniref:transposase n=1 Tax=Candidatus Enterovibrio altilux TaxID=1927128 RepID=UPI0013747781
MIRSYNSKCSLILFLNLLHCYYHVLTISCISKRAKMVSVTLKTKNKGIIQHLAVDFTGLKIYSEN